MSSATFTIIGLKNYLEYWDRDLFSGLTLPEGIDKDLCINNILLTCGDNELLYPDGDFMIQAIEMWSKKWERTFSKWVEVLAQTYNPLENYDRMESWSDSASESSSMSSSEENSMSSSESSSASASDSSSNSTSTENDISAFNDANYSHDSASRINGVAGSSSTSNGNNVSTSSSNNRFNNNSTGESYSEHGGRIHGNIGTLTTQQMLQSELDVQRFNIYDEIAIIFAREFTLAL